MTSPGCGWSAGPFGGGLLASLPTFTPRLPWLTPDVGISHTFTHGYANTCVPTRRRVCSGECVRERAAAKQSRLSVARGLWRQICLNAFIVSRGGRGGREGDVAPRVRRGDVAFRGAPAHSRRWQLLLLLHLLQAWCTCSEERCANQLIQDSLLSGEVKLQLLTSGRKKTWNHSLQFVMRCSGFVASTLPATPGEARG